MRDSSEIANIIYGDGEWTENAMCQKFINLLYDPDIIREIIECRSVKELALIAYQIGFEVGVKWANGE